MLPSWICCFRLIFKENIIDIYVDVASKLKSIASKWKLSKNDDIKIEALWILTDPELWWICRCWKDRGPVTAPPYELWYLRGDSTRATLNESIFIKLSSTDLYSVKSQITVQCCPIVFYCQMQSIDVPIKSMYFNYSW